MTFKEYYIQEVRKKLMDDLKLKNPMEAPRIIKIVVNVGAGEAITSKGVLEKIQEQMALITGQRPVITKARKSVSAFKIRKGVPIGVKVTLRGGKMYDFLEKLIKIVIPRLRDFRGLSEGSIDGNGNLNIGFSEQTLFPEIEFDKIDKVRGMEITIVTTAPNDEQSLAMLSMLGMPFRKV